MATNLPSFEISDSAAGTKLYFDTYGEAGLEYAANDVTAAVGFFESTGFDTDAAETVAMTLLRQAKIDATPISQVLDTLKGFPAKNLSQLVAEILNNNRVPSSILGYRTADVKVNQTRNIAA